MLEERYFHFSCPTEHKALDYDDGAVNIIKGKHDEGAGEFPNRHNNSIPATGLLSSDVAVISSSLLQPYIWYQQGLKNVKENYCKKFL